MKNIFSLILISLFSLGILSAHTSFKLNPNPRSKPLGVNAQDTLKILAVMVEFQKDNDGNTFGNGKFGSIYSQDYGSDILDPLPHNTNYFKDHLLFAKNYYEKASKGMQNISFTVLPNIITVSKVIRDYSPQIQSDDFSGLGSFAEEVWGLVDQSSQINFSDYDLFTIFHAGVGREIPTPGSIGLERDIPSVYLSEATLKNIFGSTFEGFPVSGGNFKIKNTAILPSTENREIESFGETYLQEFSINGLIVGTIASYIGLPDLFNTETGTSAIGRFGLMDGQALFAYNGVFPPEPSAWEKVYLGWVTPTEIDLQNQTIQLTSYQTATAGDKTLIKIPINANEYYLIENRKRDANKDGVTLTYKVGSSTNSITFDKDYPAFSPFGADTLIGVITDVDEFDWALPAFEEEQSFEDSFEDIGFIIWHIDEEVIRNNLESNTINNDRDRLGVQVVEADGIFDIGEEFLNIFGETQIGEGTKQDTWYASNPSKFYENKFDATTKPAAVSNLGANSLVSISNISTIANSMSFDLKFTNNSISKLVDTKLDIDQEIKNVFAIENYIAVYAGTDIFLYDSNGKFLVKVPNVSTVQPAVFTINNTNYIVGALNNRLKVYSFDNQVVPVLDTYELEMDENVSAPVVIGDANVGFDIFIGTEKGKILVYNYSEDKFELSTAYSAFNNIPVTQVVSNHEQQIVFAIAGNQYWNSVYSSEVISFTSNLKKLVVTPWSMGDIVTSIALVLESDNKISVVPLSRSATTIVVESDGAVNDFLVTDLKYDRNDYLVYPVSNKVEAVNFIGSKADYFPVNLKSEVNEVAAKYCLSADLDRNGYYDVLTFGSNGLIYANDGERGDLKSGFPITSGASSNVHPVIVSNTDTRLIVINENKELLVWRIGSVIEQNGWFLEFANNYNNAFFALSQQGSTTTEFFPQTKAYNWPNPVYEGETKIRFYVSENAQAEVKIFDLAGDLVAELSAQATGGMDNEITWNVNDIQSGIYFAHINVQGDSGKSDSKLIKIAVVK